MHQECALNRTIETERLILRPIEPGDWRAVHGFTSLPEVMRYLHDEPFTEDDARQFATRWSAQTGDGWPEVMAVLLRADGRMIGYVPFEWYNPKYRTREIGWVFHPEHHGQGYATEAARAVLRLAFETLGLHRVVADCDPRNTASYRVMEKLGMRREAHHVNCVQIHGEWADEYFYAILAEEWARP
jgi:ribosomal-protein-alanine N-acetyltransferase